ncbi:MAG: DNA polymerase III subunit alpha [Planctomycetes bacterium]|nr:DNA polymerase III subunit alpha [Planctomycetota bacterium]
MTVPDFVHLRTHSHYSLLTAPARVKDLVKAAAADGQRALALTDNGNLYGAIEFYKACKGAEIKPILGMVAFLAGKSRREPTSTSNPNYQLTLLATNDTGWDNLKKLSTIGFLEGFYYRPRIDREALAAHAGGLIALTGDLSGEVPRLVQQDDLPTACRALAELEDLLGKGNVFLELMEIGVEAQSRVNQGLVAIHRRLGTPICATNDVHYVQPDDWVAQDIMTCIRNGKSLNDPERFRMPSRELWFKSRAAMAQAFRELPEALASTVEIAQHCKVDIPFNVYHLPTFGTGSSESPDQLFERLCYEGAVRRYGEISDAIRTRLTYEIDVIRKLGFASYFLITADFIAHARASNIPVGPGRGSAAGSMVAFALGITNLDPLRYNLLFERFLNASRVSMPDIDVDFCGERRDEVIRYVRDKYGEDCVSQIVTFGTMASRGVLRDVGRVLEVDLGEIDKIAKKVPQGPGASLAKALESDPELVQIKGSSESISRLFDLGLKLEGLARHSSVHAAGVVVADRPLRDYVPLCRSGEEITTQWQMTELETVGLLKVDFLGLKTLTILEECKRLVRENHGRELDLDTLALDDQPTYALMTRGDTLGVFQLESSGMRDLLARLAPDTFEDVIAVLALYRPGPLSSGMVDMFVRRKHGEEPVAYPHEDTREVLQETYGVIVYQEQVMRISNLVGGFSMNEADSLRKAMGKKKPEEMAKFKEKFVTGATAKGHAATWARELFETMEYFAGYGFNKSHSAAYALVTYQTAWLKAHFPVEFYAANMTVESSNSDKLKEFVDEARRIGFPVRSPDVNASGLRFGVEAGSIRFGLGAIKGVGTRFAESVELERKRKGPYASIENLCERQDTQLVNKGALEALVKAGAFDSIEATRKSAIEGLEAAVRGAAQVRRDKAAGQRSLFDLGEAPPAPTDRRELRAAEWTEMERLANEKEALGFYLSGHPFEKRGRFFARIAGRSTADLATLESGTEVRIAGMVSGLRVLVVKTGRSAGQKMARFRLEDLDGAVSVVVFARVYERVREKLADDAILFVSGRVEKNAEEVGLLCDNLEQADDIASREVQSLIVRLPASLPSDRVLDSLADAVTRSRGSHRLLLEVEENGATHVVRADQRYSVRIDDNLIDDLALIVGPENLSFRRR